MAMNKITGKKVEQLPYPDIHKVADLTYFDGPLLSLFRDTENHGYLYYWCDADETYNRWLVLRITEEHLAMYIKQRLPLDEILSHPVGSELFIVDINAQGKQCSIVLMHPDQLPSDYLPQKGSFFDPTASVFYEQDIITDIILFLLDEVHELREPKIGYPQYNQHLLPVFTVHNAADKWHKEFRDSKITRTALFFTSIPKHKSYNTARP